MSMRMVCISFRHAQICEKTLEFPVIFVFNKQTKWFKHLDKCCKYQVDRDVKLCFCNLIFAPCMFDSDSFVVPSEIVECVSGCIQMNRAYTFGMFIAPSNAATRASRLCFCLI